MYRSSLRVVTSFLAVALLAAACGGGSGSAEPEPSAKRTVDPYPIVRGKAIYAEAIERLDAFPESVMTTMVLVDEKPNLKDPKPEDQVWVLKSSLTLFAMNQAKFTLEFDDVKISGRIVDGEFFAKIKRDDGPQPCWFSSTLKDLNSTPDFPFEVDLDSDSLPLTMLKTGKVQSWTIDPDYPSNYKLDVDVDAFALAATILPGIRDQSDALGDLGTVGTTIWTEGNAIVYVEFELSSVFEELIDRDMDGAEIFREFRELNPSGSIGFDSLPPEYGTKRPTDLCPEIPFTLTT